MKKTEKTTLLKEEDSNPDQNPEEQSNNVLSRVKGVAAIFAYTVLMGASKISVQALNRSIPDFELNALRCGFTLLCMGFYNAITKTSIRISKESILGVILLSLAINLVTIGSYVSVTLVPLAIAQCLLYACALSSGLIIFRLVNKEPLKFDKLIAVPVCITGVLLVMQPEFIFSGKRKHQVRDVTSNMSDFSFPLDISENTSSHLDHHGNVTKFFSNTTVANKTLENVENITLTILGYIISVATGLMLTIQISILKYYQSFFTPKNVLKSLVWTYMMGTILSLVPMVIYEHPVLPSGLKETLLVIVHVCTCVLVMPLLLYGSLLISGNLSSILKTCVLVYLLVAQYTILKDIHPGHRNWIEILGVILVLFGTIFSSVVEIVKGFGTEK